MNGTKQTKLIKYQMVRPALCVFSVQFVTSLATLDKVYPTSVQYNLHIIYF